MSTNSNKDKLKTYTWKSLLESNCAYVNDNSKKKPVQKLKKISLEEAIVWPTQTNDEVFKPILWYDVLGGKAKNKIDRELDITGTRLKEMNENNVSYQIIAPTAAGLQYLKNSTEEEQIKKAKEVNDYMYNKIKEYPKRFKAFAVLPMGSPKAAAKELERCIKELGMVGSLVNGCHISYKNSKPIALFYDTPEYDILWKKFVELDVPLYIHPTVYPSTDNIIPDIALNDFYQKYPQLLGSPFGFHHNLSQHILRLILSGVFDRFPKFKLILGHMGEYLPWLAERFDHRMCAYKLLLTQITKKQFDNENFKEWKFPKLTLLGYLRQNIYITTSGWFSDNDLKYVIEKIGIDRVLFSIDYPYEYQSIACDWMDRVPLSLKDKKKIAYKNAEKLLKIKV